jgi:hypothetical protein
VQAFVDAALSVAWRSDAGSGGGPPVSKRFSRTVRMEDGF